MNVGSVGALRTGWTVGVLLVLAACGGGGNGGTAPPPPPPVPGAVISATRVNIQEGESTQLSWSSTNADSCVAFGGWGGPLAASGTRVTDALSASTTFSLSCSGPGGTSPPAQVTVTVNSVPPSLIFDATRRILRDTQTSTLTWSSVKVSSCQASGEWSGSLPPSGSQTVGPFTQAGMHHYVLQCAATTGPTLGSSLLLHYRTGTNLPPIANAGPDQVAGSTHRVDLSGLSSTDENHAIASFSWTQTAGRTVTLGPGPSRSSASFIAPTVTTDELLTFELTVTDDEGLTSAPDSVNVTVKPIPATVTISGEVRYERVPLVLNRGLSYADQNYETISDVFVEVLDAATQTPIESGTFLADFQFTVPSQTDLVLRATARTSRQSPFQLPHWDISVRDLDASGAPLTEVYSYTGPPFNSGAGGRQTLQIPSGWNSAGQLVGPRAAAPFAILDSARVMLRGGLDFPQPDLPPLTIDWSPSNRGGETFYVADGGAHRLVLSGEVDVDTDEYDPAVILHELSHYILNTVSRDESVGGPHAFGDLLDMRVAFSEGFATAFGAFASGQAVYADSFGPGQADSSFFSLNVDQTLNEGWYSEFSIQEILWDFGDSSVWQAMHEPMQQTDALTSAFPFFTALKELDPSRASSLDSLLAGENIVGPTINDYGSTETHDAGHANVLPIYTSIALGGSVQVRSTNEIGTGNKLGVHRYLRFSLQATTNVRFQISAAADKDADIAVFRRGVSLGPPQGPANEDFSLLLNPGEYVLDVYECGNAECNSSVTPGPTDITVSISAL